MNVLVIGGGSIGERHLRCFQKSGRADVSLCEIAGDLRKRLVREYGLGDSFADFDAALASQPEAAVICTPAHLHVSMARRLVDAGVHVLIEKPLSTSRDGVTDLQRLVADRGVTAAVAYVYRAHPALQQMKQALDAGRFGRPVQVVVTSGQHFPFYRPAYREIYYARRETGGGAIQDALTHLVNAAEWLVGPITRLTADADHLVLDGVDVEDTAHLLARHGEVMAAYTLNQHQPPNESSLTVICDRGAVRLESPRHRWLSATEPGAEWKVEAAFELERDDLFVFQANAFLDMIERRSIPACTLEEAAQTLRVTLAALESVEQRAWRDVAAS
jgi:predicted dehydrogenase